MHRNERQGVHDVASLERELFALRERVLDVVPRATDREIEDALWEIAARLVECGNWVQAFRIGSH